MAASSPSLQANFYASSSKFCFVKLDRFNRRSFSCKRKAHSSWIIKSVLNNKESSINGDEAIEPARILLEKLFAQTQKLEEKIGKDLNLSQDIELELNLGKLESDLQTALAVLRKKEEELEAAEDKIFSEYRDLNQAKEELGKREEVITAAFLRQEKLEEELKKANLDLASQATEVRDLKLQLEKRDKETTAAQSALLLKENEVNIMVNELKIKTSEAENTQSELMSKSRILVETKEILDKQTVEIQELRKAVREKDEELQISMTILESEEKKLKVVESNLEKQTMDWLVAQEEMKKLAAVEVNESLEDFMRVRKLLADVRAELVLSQKSLSLSRKKMEDQQEILEKELVELAEHQKSLSLYTETLGDAEMEVESERVKLRLAEARNQELERDLSMEKELINELQNHLKDEKLSLKQATEEISVLRDELDRRNSEYEEIQNLLESKESQLVEAKLEIQHLKSEKEFLELMLEEKESKLSDAQIMLGEVNQEILNLKSLLSIGDEKLIETTSLLKEKEEQVDIMQNDLNETKMKYSEATIVVERILDLTNKVVSSIEQEGYKEKKPTESNSKWEKKQLENELEVMKETLRSREMEVLQTRRALTIKDNELKMVLEKLEERDKEMKEMKLELTKDADDLRKLYAMAQERIGEKNMGEFAIEKLQFEAAQLQVEAVTIALEKITEMSRDLLRSTSLVVEADYDLDISALNMPEKEVRAFEDDRCFFELKNEVVRLSDLTEKLIREAGITADSNGEMMQCWWFVLKSRDGKIGTGKAWLWDCDLGPVRLVYGTAI